MTKIKLKVYEIYELRAQIAGLVIPDKEGQPNTVYRGIVNEPGVTEGVKRALNKNARILNTELGPIDEQRKLIQLTQQKEGQTAEELALDIKVREDEVLQSETELELELVEFSKVENLTFSMNYEFAYEKIFK